MALIRPLATRSADRSFKNIHSLGFASYVATVREALTNANESVVVVTPFLDSDGIDLLEESWTNRVHDASWDVYVRTASPRLMQKAAKMEWRVFEYRGDKDSGMHAKIVSVDDNRLILGSMNLINKNMYSNLEIGVDITDDPIVRKIKHLENWLQEACERNRVIF